MSALRPVEFRKSRKHAPRLSAPRVPGRRNRRYWPEEEKDIVRHHYPRGGVVACEAHLPGRDRRSIYAQAFALGLRSPNPGGGPKKRLVVPVDIDDRIREAWPLLDGKKRGAVSELADRLGVPRWWLTTRAVRLGLALPHRKEPRWTAAEEALLGRVPLHDLKRSAQIFREHGFKRSATSIAMRCKKLRISRRYDETLSATTAARILGIDAKTMSQTCIAGEIKATRRGTNRLPQQGGDVWSIEPADLRRYVLDNIERIDLRKVDKLAFVQLIAQEPLT